MPIWITWAIDFFVHNFKRFMGVLFIAALIVVPIYMVRNYIKKQEVAQYNLGYKTGYEKAIKDNPPQTYANVGTVVNNAASPNDTIFDLGIYKLRFGMYWKK